MTLTDQVQRFYAVAGGMAKDLKDNLANPDKRAAYVEAGRTAVSQGTALVTDKAAAVREQTKDVTTKGVEFVQTHGPKVVKPARRLASKAAKTSQEKAPVARSFASRNRDEIFLVLAIVEVVLHFRRIQRKRRGNKK